MNPDETVDNLWTAESTGDVCYQCGKPEDDHLVRELREHKAKSNKPSDFVSYDKPQLVLTDSETRVKGVVVFSALLPDQNDELIPALIFRFMLDNDELLPDISYPAHGLELMNCANIIMQAARGAITTYAKMGRRS